MISNISDYTIFDNPISFLTIFFSAISQRDCASYYDYLGRDKADLEDKIVDFWEEKIRGKFNLNKCKHI